jgi:hypothetical protein
LEKGGIVACQFDVFRIAKICGADFRHAATRLQNVRVASDILLIAIGTNMVMDAIEDLVQ